METHHDALHKNSIKTLQTSMLGASNMSTTLKTSKVLNNDEVIIDKDVKNNQK
jgi:hypothetical protein